MSHDGAQGGAAGGPGRSIAGGRYQVRDLLGAGGMASVYLAHDTVLDRQVAIKTLHTELGREEAFRERFRREAQSVAKLSHTNIVSVFDTGEDTLPDTDGGAKMPYIVMEYVEGRPLRSVLDEDIARYGAMPTDKALKIAADVLAALEVSHEMGLVHRDIKPGNVMMNKRNVVKVMDFGIARAMQSGVTSMTQTGMVVGTPQYLSPEQALGRGVDARSDLYSVGIMLFELLTGRLPFDADSPLAIAYAHVQEEPVAPSSINSSIPPAVDALVARALKKNPNERFPTAEAMRDECARVSSSGATGAGPQIVSGAAGTRSGAGVGSAVFPPVDQQTPAPQHPHTPYQPQPASGAGQLGGFGPSTPPPASQPMGGYGTPAPGPYGSGVQTPPPYVMAPGGAPAGGGRKNMPVVVGAIAVALLAIGGLITAIAMNNGDDGGKQADDRQTNQPVDPGSGGTEADTDTGSGSDADSEPESGKAVPEDKSRTIDEDKCTDAYEHYDDQDSVSMPDFFTRNLSSVKDCMNAAGWKYNEVEYEDSLWGKNSVIEQIPRKGEAFNPEEDKITLTVASGKTP
ncbi:protein kinase [Streptomyces sp. Ru87]|uniref:protein kinase domain-containing protein n=1 Tax=Streptomyces sp. Ru87 TaxID=2044307 RepID=UPI000BF7FF63|nr:protein kinase [Streptomyces sp. Ru87]PGH49427.1 serine/threonine protein kinase [Streptomyces sp. Ru87]